MTFPPYVVTGSWGQKALAEARKEGDVTVAWDGPATSFTTVPDLEVLDIDGAAYVHVTSNETIEGVEFPGGFEPAGPTILVCDASSDFLSRPIGGRPLRPAVRRGPEERRARGPDDRGRA